VLFSATKPSSCFRGAGPSPRSNHVAALYDDRILLIFGGQSKSKTLNDVHALDFETVCSIRFLQFFFLIDLLLKESFFLLDGMVKNENTWSSSITSGRLLWSSLWDEMVYSRGWKQEKA
jgi:hypothetical protein